MSQKSILSFFKKTPVKEASSSPEIKSKLKSEPDVSPPQTSQPTRKKILPDSDECNSDSDEQLMNNRSLAGKKKRRRMISSSEEEQDAEASDEKKSPLIVASNGKKLRASNSPPAIKTDTPDTPPPRPTKSPRKSPSTSPPNTKSTTTTTAAAKKSKPADVSKESKSSSSEDEAKPKKSPAATKKKPSPAASKNSSEAESTPSKAKKSPSGAATTKRKPQPTAASKKKPSPAAAATKSSPNEATDVKVETADDTDATIKSEPPAVAIAVAKGGIHNFFTRPAPANGGPKADPKQTAAAAAAYNPARPNYDPIADAFWSAGEKVPYLALTKTFSIIEDTSGRLKMIEYLANFLRSVIALSPTDLTACLYLCLNQLAPAYEGLELGVAETTLLKVIAQTTGRTLAQVRQDAKDTGDLGLVAEQSKSTQRMMFVPAPLTVPGVFAKLKDIATKTGGSAASNATKADKIQSIFVACRQSEARYFIRSLVGKLRIGLAEQSVLQALGQAAALQLPAAMAAADADEKKTKTKKLTGDALKAHIDAAALIVKTTHCQCPNYEQICTALLAHGLPRLLELCPMRPGTPLKPMLAHPTRGIAEVLQRFDGIRFTAEFKYDGERAQIHVDSSGAVTIYSRNQECNTTKYPDVVGRVERAFVGGRAAMRSCILDCEAVAWDAERQQILPFQVLSTRKRKDARVEEIQVQVVVFVFDLLYWDGEPLVTRPFAERRGLLQERFREVDGEWRFARSVDTADMDELQQFLEVSIKGNCEGLMVKTLDGRDATYEIAKRSRNWLKIKKDYLTGVGDSLDLVVIGGYHGKGRRTGNYGGFLLACYDPDAEQYQTICKIGTGFSDEDLARHTEFLGGHVIKAAKPYYAYDAAAHEPDMWFEAVQVWEVLCADLSLSPVHQAAKGIVDPEKGISLRFPRFIRIRDDKSAEDATSAQQVADMYSNQDQIKNQDKSGAGGKDVEEDFY